MNEAKLQSDIIKWLKSRNCYVIKHNAGPGVPTGCPDVSFYYEGFYGFIEVKARHNSPYQALQESTLDRLGRWSWAKVVYPDNWLEIRTELEAML